jgi:hypothetical protein
MSEFFNKYPQSPFMIRHFESKTPLFFHDVSMMLGIFLADKKAAMEHLPSSDFKVISPFPGKALVGINCFQYKSSDIGPYNEVSISVAVERKKWRPGFVSVITSTLSQNYHANILQLPVTTEVALHGGLDFFNYPKFMSSIDFTEDDNKQTCEVKDHGTNELLFKFSGKKIKTKKSKKLNTALYNSYPIMNNELLQADLLVNQVTKGTKWLGSDFTLEIGNHPKSELLKALKLTKLMQYVYMPLGQAILFEPKNLNQ